MPIVFVIRNQQPDLEKHRPGIQQLCDPLPRRQLAIAMLLFDSLRPAALAQLVFKRLQIIDQLTHLTGTGGGHPSQNTVLIDALQVVGNSTSDDSPMPAREAILAGR